MDSKIGSNIKKYRKLSDITQERLAEYLSVSHQAVSKWESGEVYPDVELLPRMASIFHISIDVLFGYKLQNEDDEINNILIQIESLGNANKLNEAEVKCREGLFKYPTSYRLMERLATVLKTRYLTDKKDKSILNEAIEKANIVISECTEIDVCLVARRTIAICYAYLGDEQKALYYANTIPVNYDNVKIYIYNGETKINECKNDISIYAEMIKKRLKLIGKVYMNQSNTKEADLYMKLSENFKNPIA